MNTITVSRHPLITSQVARGPDAASEDCPICFNALNPNRSVTVLDCQHWFDTSCLSVWINVNGNNFDTRYACPLCRENLSNRKITVLKNIHRKHDPLLNAIKAGISNSGTPKAAEALEGAKRLFIEGAVLTPDELSQLLMKSSLRRNDDSRAMSSFLRSMGAELRWSDLRTLLVPDEVADSGRNRTNDLVRGVSSEFTPSERAAAMVILIESGGSGWKGQAARLKATSAAPLQQDMSSALLNVIRNRSPDWKKRVKELEKLGASLTENQINKALRSVMQSNEGQWIDVVLELKARGGTPDQGLLNRGILSLIESGDSGWKAKVRKLTSISNGLPQQALNHAVLRVIKSHRADHKDRVKVLESMGAALTQEELNRALSSTVEFRKIRWIDAAHELSSMGAVPDEKAVNTIQKEIVKLIESDDDGSSNRSEALRKLKAVNGNHPLPKELLNSSLRHVLMNFKSYWQDRVKELQKLGAALSQDELNNCLSFVIDNRRQFVGCHRVVKKLVAMGAIPNQQKLNELSVRLMLTREPAWLYNLEILKLLGVALPQKELNDVLAFVIEQGGDDWSVSCKTLRSLGAVLSPEQLRRVTSLVLHQGRPGWFNRVQVLRHMGATMFQKELNSILWSKLQGRYDGTVADDHHVYGLWELGASLTKEQLNKLLSFNLQAGEDNWKQRVKKLEYMGAKLNRKEASDALLSVLLVGGDQWWRRVGELKRRGAAPTPEALVSTLHSVMELKGNDWRQRARTLKVMGAVE